LADSVNRHGWKYGVDFNLAGRMEKRLKNVANHSGGTQTMANQFSNEFVTTSGDSAAPDRRRFRKHVCADELWADRALRPVP